MRLAVMCTSAWDDVQPSQRQAEFHRFRYALIICISNSSNTEGFGRAVKSI